MTWEGANVHFADTAETMITLCMKDLKMFSLATNFESTRPIPHHVETDTAPCRDQDYKPKFETETKHEPRPQKIGLETYITCGPAVLFRFQ